MMLDKFIETVYWFHYLPGNPWGVDRKTGGGGKISKKEQCPHLLTELS